METTKPHGRERVASHRCRPAFIGDEVSAAGYRLAGIRVYTPDDEEEALLLFRRLMQETELIILSIDVARKLPPEEVKQAVRALTPLVLVVPDLRGQTPMRDLSTRLRTELGIQLT